MYFRIFPRFLAIKQSDTVQYTRQGFLIFIKKSNTEGKYVYGGKGGIYIWRTIGKDKPPDKQNKIKIVLGYNNNYNKKANKARYWDLLCERILFPKKTFRVTIEI